MKKQSRNITLYHSKDDSVVPFVDRPLKLLSTKKLSDNEIQLHYEVLK